MLPIVPGQIWSRGLESLIYTQYKYHRPQN